MYTAGGLCRSNPLPPVGRRCGLCSCCSRSISRSDSTSRVNGPVAFTSTNVEFKALVDDVLRGQADREGLLIEFKVPLMADGSRDLPSVTGWPRHRLYRGLIIGRLAVRIPKQASAYVQAAVSRRVPEMLHQKHIRHVIRCRETLHVRSDWT